MVTMKSGQAAQAALREQRWQELEGNGGFLSDAAVAALSPTVRDGLIGVQRPGGMRYPAFQVVDEGDGTWVVPPAWPRLRDLLAPAQWDDEFQIRWTVATNAFLDGDSPANEIQAHPADVTDRLRYAVDRAIPWTKKAEWTGNDLAY